MALVYSGPFVCQVVIFCLGVYEVPEPGPRPTPGLAPIPGSVPGRYKACNLGLFPHS